MFYAMSSSSDSNSRNSTYLAIVVETAQRWRLEGERRARRGDLAPGRGGGTPSSLHGAELPAHLAAELAELIDDAERYAAAAQAINTTRAYASDWNQFQAWCERYQLASMPAPAAVIALYVTSLARRGLAVSTIRRRAAAIARAHRQAGHLPATSDPRVLTVLEGIARVHGSAPNKKTALLRDPLLELIDRIDTSTPAGLRDRALLLLGFAVGLRRSELVALTVEDLSPFPRRAPDPDRSIKDRPARPRPRAPWFVTRIGGYRLTRSRCAASI